MASSSAEFSADYPHLPGHPENPLMESTLHVQWGHFLVGAIKHVLTDSDDLVTGNVGWQPSDGGPRIAPDLMVIPGKAGQHFGAYMQEPDEPPPSACIEILSPSKTKQQIDRRIGRMLSNGVGEVYVIDPIAEWVDRVTIGESGELVYADGRGQYSPVLGITFGHAAGLLAACCPAGLVVRPDDDPYHWIVAERRRGDAAASELADAADRAAIAEQAKVEAEQGKVEAEQRAEAAEAELARLRKTLAD